MEKQLKCVLLLSLKELTLRRVAVLLCSGSDTLASIAKFDFFAFRENEKKWQETAVDNVKDKVMKLEMPKSLRKPMIDIIKSMSSDIRRWAESHKDYFLDSRDQMPPYLAKLCWSAAGNIDNRKTAEQLVRCDGVYLVGLGYKLACFYCLEDYIPHIWENLPNESKIFYYKNKDREPHLEFYWPYILDGKLSKLDSLLSTLEGNPFTLYQFFFEYSAKNGHRTATEYFFRKLTFEERANLLMRSTLAVLSKIQNIDSSEDCDDFELEKYAIVLCYLLSVMTLAQQMEIFKSRPLDVLFSFPYWPRQDLFIQNIGLIWTILPPRSYKDLLFKMYCRYRTSDFYLPKSYQELFTRSPLEFKKCFEVEKNEDDYIELLCLLFDYEDSETLGVIFEKSDAESRVKLIFHPQILNYFFCSVWDDKWPLVEACLRATMLSKEEKERMKKSLMEYLKSVRTWKNMTENRSLKTVFKLLDVPDAISEVEKNGWKRKLENCLEG